PFGHTEHRSQSQSGASLPLGAEKRLERPRLHLVRHAAASIRHGYGHRAALTRSVQGNGPPAGHCIDRIEDQVGNSLFEIVCPAIDDQIWFGFYRKDDRPPFGLWSIPPARSGVTHHF